MPEEFVDDKASVHVVEIDFLVNVGNDSVVAALTHSECFHVFATRDVVLRSVILNLVRFEPVLVPADECVQFVDVICFFCLLD